MQALAATARLWFISAHSASSLASFSSRMATLATATQQATLTLFRGSHTKSAHRGVVSSANEPLASAMYAVYRRPA